MAGQRMPDVDLRVLGPLEVEVGGSLLDPGGPRLRAMLALLAAYAGRPVSVALFVSELWGPVAPPEGAIVNEQWQVSPDDPVRIVTADSTAAPSR